MGKDALIRLSDFFPENDRKLEIMVREWKQGDYAKHFFEASTTLWDLISVFQR